MAIIPVSNVYMACLGVTAQQSGELWQRWFIYTMKVLPLMQRQLFVPGLP